MGRSCSVQQSLATYFKSTKAFLNDLNIKYDSRGVPFPPKLPFVLPPVPKYIINKTDMPKKEEPKEETPKEETPQENKEPPKIEVPRKTNMEMKDDVINAIAEARNHMTPLYHKACGHPF